VALRGVILKLQRTAGSSVTHHPLNLLSLSKIQGLMPYRTMPLAHSTCPFIWGCATAAQSTLMWLSSQNLRNFFPMNYVPLSVIMEFETPKW
jgi:hypothetical protein